MNMNDTKFKDEDHKLNYDLIVKMMRKVDCYHAAVAYLFALDHVCFQHLNRLFDFGNDSIKSRGLDEAWQTSTSRRTTRLAFNLYNGWCTDGETYIGSDGFEEALPSVYYTPYHIFSCPYAPYYVEAMKIRFPECFEK